MFLVDAERELMFSLCFLLFIDCPQAQKKTPQALEKIASSKSRSLVECKALETKPIYIVGFHKMFSFRLFLNLSQASTASEVVSSLRTLWCSESDALVGAEWMGRC